MIILYRPIGLLCHRIIYHYTIRPLEKFLSIYKGEQRVKMIEQNEIDKLKETIMRLQQENRVLYDENMKLNEIIIECYTSQKQQLRDMKQICKDVLGDD